MSAAPVTRGAIEIRGIVTQFGSNVVHNNISFAVAPGCILCLIGGSGTGKSTLLKEIIGLERPTAGDISLLGVNLLSAPEAESEAVRRRIGVLFQNGALFSALTVGENIAAPLVEQSRLDDSLIRELVQLRLSMVGLPPETALKYPSELSGGMRKRVALARALALEPEILFLDEPTSGLDPINARAFDHLIFTLSRSLGLTVFMVTHDVDTILGISDRIIVLERGKILADGTPSEIVSVQHPWIQEYFATRTADKPPKGYP